MSDESPERPPTMPLEMWEAFRTQRNNARQRGIPFEFTVYSWWAWWQVDNRWVLRGRRQGQLVMARYGDTGPYRLGNVYCATAEQNLADIRPEVRRAGGLKGALRRDHQHLTDRETHPRVRPVVTQAGRFASAALAADHYGITRQQAAFRARTRWKDWSYEDEPVPTPPKAPSPNAKLLRLHAALNGAAAETRAGWCLPRDIPVEPELRSISNLNALADLGLAESRPVPPTKRVVWRPLPLPAAPAPPLG